MCRKTSLSRWLMQSFIVSVVFAAATYTQTQTPTVPNLSGNWQLDQIGDNRDNSDAKFPRMTLVIAREANQLKVTEKRIKQGKEEVRTFVYNVDGQASTNIGRVEVWRTEDPKFESVTHVEKDRVVTEYKREWRLGNVRSNNLGIYFPRETTSQVSDLWSLDASGNRLTLTTRSLSTPPPLALRGASVSAEPPASDPGSDRTAPTAYSTMKLKFRRM